MDLFKQIVTDNPSLAQILKMVEADQEFQAYLAQNDDWSHLGLSVYPPLAAAAWTGQAEALRELLSHYHIQVDARYESGSEDSCNALTVAICLNKADCVRVLLDYGADINLGGIWGGRPFRNAGQLDQLCKEGKLTHMFIKDRDDTIKKMLEEEGVKGDKATWKKMFDIPETNFSHLLFFNTF